jgi:hypothetical protein
MTMTFGEDEALHPEKYDIFTPDVKEFDTPGRYTIVLGGGLGVNETVEIQVYENGCYTILEEDKINTN